MKKLILVAAVFTIVVFAFGAITALPSRAADAWNAAVGVIQKIDAAAKTFEVKAEKKVSPRKPAEVKMMTIATYDKTKIFTLVNGKKKKLSFTDLKEGMKIGFTYNVEGGKNIATSIEVRAQ